MGKPPLKRVLAQVSFVLVFLLVPLISYVLAQAPADSEQSAFFGNAKNPEAISFEKETSDLNQPKAIKQQLQLLREGTEVRGLISSFDLAGDSATIRSHTGRKIGVLRNLNLQRVLKVLRTSSFPSKISWKVSGVITEYDGKNYLLITHAIRKSAAENLGSRRAAKFSTDKGQPLSKVDNSP